MTSEFPSVIKIWRNCWGSWLDSFGVCTNRDLFVRRQCITTYLSSIVHIRLLAPSTASIRRSCDTLATHIYVCCKAMQDNRSWPTCIVEEREQWRNRLSLLACNCRRKSSMNFWWIGDVWTVESACCKHPTSRTVSFVSPLVYYLTVGLTTLFRPHTPSV